MAVRVLQDGPKNLTVLVNTGGGTLTVSALNFPCVGLVLSKVQASADAVGSIAGPASTVWTLAAGNQHMCFDKFGGINDSTVAGNWTLTLSAGIAVLSFDKVRSVHPNPN